MTCKLLCTQNIFLCSLIVKHFCFLLTTWLGKWSVNDYSIEERSSKLLDLDISSTIFQETSVMESIHCKTVKGF